MRTSLTAGAVAIAVVAVGVGLTGCGSGTKTAPSTSSKQTTSESTTTTSSKPAAAGPGAMGPNKTIVDYIKENNIVETPVHHGDPGSPAINLPTPQGWQDAGGRTPGWAYSAILFSDPAVAQDPPTIIALVSKLSGNADPAQILQYAPGEIKNLPGYDGAPDGSPSTLAGFNATQIGGTYVRDGVKRAIAQKTVVIPGKDGLYVMQLNADGTEDQMGPLMDATNVIDEKTTITP